MKKTIAIIAVMLCSAMLWALPNGKQHKDISIMAGVISYNDGTKAYGIIAISKNESGEIVIQQIKYSKTVDIELLTKTIKNQEGLTERDAKKYGFFIDQKRRKVSLTETTATFEPAFGSSFKWQFSKKLTDEIVLVIPDCDFTEPKLNKKPTKKIEKKAINQTDNMTTKEKLWKQRKDSLKELLK